MREWVKEIKRLSENASARSASPLDLKPYIYPSTLQPFLRIRMVDVNL